MVFTEETVSNFLNYVKSEKTQENKIGHVKQDHIFFNPCVKFRLYNKRCEYKG